jgi:spore germination protein YaaH
MPTSWDTVNALASFHAHAGQMDEVSPFWYSVDRDGTLDPYAGARDASLVQFAHARGILVIPTVSNNFDPDRVHRILNDPNLRALHIGALTKEVQRYGYDGIDIDYENLYAEDREAFSDFVSELASEVHKLPGHRLLTIAVHSKRSEPGSWSGARAQDWHALGSAADEFRVMTYDYCWKLVCDGSWGSPPGPIAPTWWMEEVIRFAMTQVPAAKVMMGVHFYGYDWDSSGIGTALTWLDVQSLLATHGAEVRWWPTDSEGRPVEEHWFSYGNGHGVVFADHDSVRARWRLAQRLGVRGVAIWRLGSEDPQNWQAMMDWRTYMPLATVPAHG